MLVRFLAVKVLGVLITLISLPSSCLSVPACLLPCPKEHRSVTLGLVWKNKHSSLFLSSCWRITTFWGFSSQWQKGNVSQDVKSVNWFKPNWFNNVFYQRTGTFNKSLCFLSLLLIFWCISSKFSLTYYESLESPLEFANSSLFETEFADISDRLEYYCICEKNPVWLQRERRDIWEMTSDVTWSALTGTESYKFEN